LAIEDGGESPEDEESSKSLLEVCMLMMVPVSISDDVLPKYVLNDFGSSICDDSSISIKLYCTKYANI